ncbi:MAG: glutaredoxin family protein [Pseudoclavibacter sp.]|nr:glutaredoxin family protein [Pseudoclavibacter sp.]
MILPLAWWRRRKPEPWGEGPAAPVVVELFGRPGCHLCEEAEAVVTAVSERLAGRVRLELRHTDITSDPDLERRYGERIPVVTVAGRLHAEWRVDPGRLERALLRAAG